MTYSVKVAKDIIKKVRLGKTLRSICKGDGMPDILEVYDWRNNPRNKLGKRSFHDAMVAAEKDRALTWQDEMVESYDYVPNTGTRQDHTLIKRIDAINSLKLRLIKDHNEMVKQATVRGGDNVNVTIRKFAHAPSKADEVELEDQADAS